MTLKVIASSLNLRGAPSTSAPILETIPMGTTLTPVDPGPFRLVRAPSGRQGWVHANYVSESPQTLADPSANWPFIGAKHFKSLKGEPPRFVRLLVVHDMEAPETATTAEEVARYFATTETVASAHLCIDADSIVRCVADRDIAYAAPGCNSDGIQLELAGYARQSRSEWLDAFSSKVLDNAATALAMYCGMYGIPPVHLTNEELKAGKRGIIGHRQASEVYRKSDHMDPGPDFPWDVLVERVKARL